MYFLYPIVNTAAETATYIPSTYEMAMAMVVSPAPIPEPECFQDVILLSNSIKRLAAVHGSFINTMLLKQVLYA